MHVADVLSSLAGPRGRWKRRADDRLGTLDTQESLDQALVATSRVLHGPERPSRLVLQIIRR
jgi:hypothetical protein